MWRFVFVLSLLFTTTTFAFPENVRYGYFSCTECHVSPSGGDVLTPYGRSLSAELMSTWGTAKTSGFMFTNVENEKLNPPWFRAEALFKGVQTYRNSPSEERAQFIPMQADLEGGFDTEKLAVIGSLGLRSKTDPSKLDDFFSRSHYLLYRFTDQWVARAGKFLTSFGLNGPDHISATRRGLNWDVGSESYNAEVNYLGTKFIHTLTLVSDSPHEDGVQREKGAALNSRYFLFGRSSLGFSLFHGGQSDYSRTVAGPYWIYAFTKYLFLDSEIFWQSKSIKLPTQSQQSGYATFHRLGYEIVKGVIPFAQFDRAYLDRSDSSQRMDSYGVGLKWLPYSHFELSSLLGKEKRGTDDPTDFCWLMMNVYL